MKFNLSIVFNTWTIKLFSGWKFVEKIVQPGRTEVVVSEMSFSATWRGRVFDQAARNATRAYSDFWRPKKSSFRRTSIICGCEGVVSSQSTGQCGHCSRTECCKSPLCNAAAVASSCYFQVVNIQKLYPQICSDSKLRFTELVSL